MIEIITKPGKRLLSRREAAERYGISIATLDRMYRQDAEFPINRIGHRVLIPVNEADAYFMRNIREVIETN